MLGIRESGSSTLDSESLRRWVGARASPGIGWRFRHCSRPSVRRAGSPVVTRRSRLRRFRYWVSRMRRIFICGCWSRHTLPFRRARRLTCSQTSFRNAGVHVAQFRGGDQWAKRRSGCSVTMVRMMFVWRPGSDKCGAGSLGAARHAFTVCTLVCWNPVCLLRPIAEKSRENWFEFEKSTRVVNVSSHAHRPVTYVHLVGRANDHHAEGE